VAYHTALALAAGQPFPITIEKRLVVARPVSVPVMLEVLRAAASTDVGQILQAEQRLLRAAFPRPRFGWRDPVRALVRLPIAIRQAVIARLMRVPHDVPIETDAQDPLAATRAWQRAAVRPAVASGPRPTLLLAAQACRAVFGEGWYYAPGRWQTTDGYVPHDVAWIEFMGLAALEARQQLVHVHAHAVAHAGKQARRSLDALVRAAYPLDPLTAAPRGGLVH
jgi:hypothetical protein